MRNLRKGLSVARNKVMQKREQALAGLPGKEASFLKLGIQILTDQTKGKEIAKYNTALQRIIEKNSDCKNHSVCNWMRDRIKKWRKEERNPQTPCVKSPGTGESDISQETSRTLTDSDRVRQEMARLVALATENSDKIEPTESTKLQDQMISVY